MTSPEPSQKFDKRYGVYSNKFQKEDFGEDEVFDPKVMPQEYLLNPQAKHVFVYVCTNADEKKPQSRSATCGS